MMLDPLRQATVERVRSIWMRVQTTRDEHRRMLIDLGRELWAWKSQSAADEYDSIVVAANVHEKTARKAVKLYVEAEGGVKAAAKPAPRNWYKTEQRGTFVPKLGTVPAANGPRDDDGMGCIVDLVDDGKPIDDAELDKYSIDDDDGDGDGDESEFDGDPFELGEVDEDEDDGEAVSLPLAGSDRAARPVIAEPETRVVVGAVGLKQMTFERRYEITSTVRTLADRIESADIDDAAAEDFFARARGMLGK